MSDKTIDDDTLRAVLAARTPGEWAPYCDEGPIRYRYLAPDGDGWTYSVCVGGHDDDHTCVLTATGPDVATARANAALAATAPALAAEVLRLRAERDELRHERDEHAHKAGEWEESHDIELARAKKAEAERDAVREDFHAMEEAFYAMQARAEAAGAIIEGRTVPPTAEEIEAHAAAGGEWLLRWPWHGPRWPWRCAAFGGAEVLIEWEEGAVCIALDRTRRPCAWPVAGGGR